ncbi:MAG TPA: hypothetical protein VJH94_04100 [Candidatus Paceibacterota bacterium]
MEQLTKQQIVLVTLLVSFVTSIATGIVTVSLMDQAPAGVTQTINRVVERTIERVVQVPSQTAAVVTKETVVVKEDDLVVAAIEQNVKNLIRVISSDVLDGSVLGLGLILSKEGIVAIDARNVMSNDSYSARLSDGKLYALKHVSDTKDGVLSLFKMSVPAGDKKVFPYAILADSDKIKLGQAVVFIGGRDDDTVETGLVSNVEYEKSPAPDTTAATTSKTTETPRKVTHLSLSMSPKSSVGGILTTLSSEVVALEVVGETTEYIPSNYLASVLSAYTASQSTTTPPVKP